MTTHITAKLADFVARTDYGDVPISAQRATGRTIRNAVALAVGAAEHPSIMMVRELHESLGSKPTLSLLGRDQKLGIFAAPLVNAMAIHVEDYDDTHLPTVVHPAAPIFPAALGAAELTNAPGATVYSAVLVGVEVALRVANGICPEHFDRGWHLTGTVGHLGAAAAAARVLGLTPEQIVVALGLAATQAAGFTSANGTMTKALHPGKAAADGLEAALLAQRGFTGPAEPIVGRRGFATIASVRVDVDQMLDGLGKDWQGELNAIKPYACGIVSHAVIDAGKSIGARVRPDQIESVEVRIPKVVLEVMGIEDPQNGLESKFSVHHCVTVGLIDGDGSPGEFSDERSTADDIVSVRRKVRAVIDAAVPKGAAIVRVRTTDGREESEEVVHATASAERPMSDAELDVKFRKLTEPSLGAGGSDRLREAVERLCEANDVTELIRASQPRNSS